MSAFTARDAGLILDVLVQIERAERVVTVDVPDFVFNQQILLNQYNAEYRMFEQRKNKKNHLLHN